MSDITNEEPAVDEAAATDTPDQAATPDPATTPDQAAAPDTDETDEADTFPRAYVEELRKENLRYRQRAQQADELAQRLHVELVRATGRLADPSDLPFDEAHLSDGAALTAAVDELLTRKPHLAARRPTVDIGQGARKQAETFNLAALLAERAG